MKEFLDDHFLLSNKTAQLLYHEHASGLPIIDYHCHLSPADLSNDRVFKSLTEIWLEGDHYKWRAMRANGINERYITGEADSKEKFDKWVQTVPYTLRNPLYHWTHLELQRYFGITRLLNLDTADEIYNRANELLQTQGYSCRNLVKKMGVEVICTTDDPIDSLEHHDTINQSNDSFHVYPTFRPDRAFTVNDIDEYNKYLNLLEEVSGISIITYTDLLQALKNRIDFFHSHGCRLSDHGIEKMDHIGDSFDPEITFKKIRKGLEVEQKELSSFRNSVMIELSRIYHERGWTQQFHLGALRNTNTRMRAKLGPDTGYDSIGDFAQSEALACFLNELDSTNQLAKTILYNLNPADNEVMATMIGNFNDGSIPGKVQYGSGWWFLDQKDGMEKQLNTLSNMGLLSRFVGMLTDSRSFMSYPRHEYFRRILCNLIGTDVENGELPNDMNLLGKLVSDVCYYNAKTYFEFDKIPTQQTVVSKS